MEASNVDSQLSIDQDYPEHLLIVAPLELFPTDHPIARGFTI
jgi:hypothetical protein